MSKSLWQRVQPHAIAIGVFFVVSCVYCMPALKGLVVMQPDIEGWRGMAQQSLEFKEKFGHYPLWTNAIFSGMPAFQVAIESMHNLTIAWLHHLFILFLPAPAGLFFLACLGFYVLCMSLGLKNKVSILGSLAYAFASYNAIIVAVGHTTKFSSMGYAPAVLAGLILLSQRRYLLGFILTLVSTTQLFYQNHLQIAYYTLLMSACLAVAFAIREIRRKEFVHLGKSAALTLVAATLGVLSFSVVLFPTYDYAKETMRGGRSELTVPGGEKDKSEGGLDKSYAFGHSYGITEVLTIAAPRMYGGGSSELPSGSKTAQVFSEKTGMGEEQADQYAQNIMPSYWGPQSFTSGAVYFGAAVCVLFIFGLVFYKGWHASWIIAATVLGILLAWGKNFETFNYFLFDHLPFYNKFRAPSMALVIPQLTFPLLAALGLNEILENNADKKEFWKKFKQALIITGILAAVLAILYFMLDYKADTDTLIRENLSQNILRQMTQQGQATPELQQQAEDFGRSVVNAARDDRKSMYGSDLVRSLIFMALAVALLYLYAKGTLNRKIASIGLIAVVFIDLIGVDLRYLSEKNYVEPENFEEAFAPTAADLQIKKDTGYFRVFNNSGGDPFQLSGATSHNSYHFNSVGGYHPAKLALYDDLMNLQLKKGNIRVFNMLNTKYFITADEKGQPVAQLNAGALGPAWFVKAVKFVDNANEEMKALDTFDPKDTAIADKRESSKIKVNPAVDPASAIKLIENLNDKITYQSNSSTGGFAVFSEVYYPNGWKAYIDGKETPIAKVNYLLRGLTVPAGQHTIEFRFHPASYYTGDTISLIIGIISILIVLYGIWVLFRNYRKELATAVTTEKQ